MKINTQSIVSELSRTGIALTDSGAFLSLAFARAVAYRLPIPTSPVDNVYQYFIETHKVAVENMLAAINEKVVVNIDATMDLVQRVWIFRYRFVFDMNNNACRSFLDAMMKVGSRELPPAVSELLIKYESSDVLDMVARAIGLAIEEN